MVSFVGIYDVLRTELSPNGEFNITEFGTVKDPAQFRAMFAYSPYEHVEKGVRYPAVLMLTGANDPRVEPMQSRKMIARLQAATASTAPILLRTSDTSGHGIGTPLAELIGETVDVYAFHFRPVGDRFPSARHRDGSPKRDAGLPAGRAARLHRTRRVAKCREGRLRTADRAC